VFKQFCASNALASDTLQASNVPVPHEGNVVGEPVGGVVGAFVGASVGEAEGALVGDPVGACVATSVCVDDVTVVDVRRHRMRFSDKSSCGLTNVSKCVSFEVLVFPSGRNVADSSISSPSLL